jgi:hypothetical protein
MPFLNDPSPSLPTVVNLKYTKFDIVSASSNPRDALCKTRTLSRRCTNHRILSLWCVLDKAAPSDAWLLAPDRRFAVATGIVACLLLALAAFATVLLEEVARGPRSGRQRWRPRAVGGWGRWERSQLQLSCSSAGGGGRGQAERTQLLLSIMSARVLLLALATIPTQAASSPAVALCVEGHDGRAERVRRRWEDSVRAPAAMGAILFFFVRARRQAAGEDRSFPCGTHVVESVKYTPEEGTTGDSLRCT